MWIELQVPAELLEEAQRCVRGLAMEPEELLARAVQEAQETLGKDMRQAVRAHREGTALLYPEGGG